jgi:hypothetical protein
VDRTRTLAWGPRERRADGKVYQHRPYAKYDTDGRNIYATMTEGNEAAYRNSVYYAEVRPGRGFCTARGRRISRLGDPPAVSRLDRVRGPSRGQRALDIAAKGGHPVIVYRRAGNPRQYWYARHDGRRWLNYKITSVYHRHEGQVASITLDHESPNTVYLSRNGSRGRFEIEVWTTPDGGNTWTHRPITRDSKVDNFLPVAPRRLTDHEEVARFAGTRTYYRDFNTHVLLKLLHAAERIAKRLTRGPTDAGDGGSR